MRIDAAGMIYLTAFNVDVVEGTGQLHNAPHTSDLLVGFLSPNR